MYCAVLVRQKFHSTRIATYYLCVCLFAFIYFGAGAVDVKFARLLYIALELPAAAPVSGLIDVFEYCSARYLNDKQILSP